MKYDFKCTECSYPEEMNFRMTEVPKEITCPKCLGKMQQFYSGDKTFILNGKGWDKPAHYK